MEEKSKCKSAVTLAVWGAVIGIVLLPSVGVSLAVSGLIVNTIGRKHYDMTVGLIANILSIILSVLSWCISAKITGFI